MRCGPAQKSGKERYSGVAPMKVRNRPFGISGIRGGVYVEHVKQPDMPGREMPLPSRPPARHDRDIKDMIPQSSCRRVHSYGGLSVGPRTVEAGRCPTAESEGYRHFLLKEIYEQPKAVLDTLEEWIYDADKLMGSLGLANKTNNLRRLHIVGCGTSYHAALIGRYIIERFVRIPVNVDISSEYLYMRPTITKGTYFIAMSQSGETVDTIGAQRDAREKGAMVFTICNSVGSTSAREADAVLYTRAGTEKGSASTKVFTSQLAALCILGMALGIEKGTLRSIEVETLKSLLLDLPGLIEKVLGNDKKIGDIAGAFVDSKGFVYLGRGINYPVAIEGASKMKELSCIHAEGYPAGEMEHGAMALIEDGAPVVFLAPIESLDEEILCDISKIKAMGGRLIVVTDSPASLKETADDLIVVPPTHPALLPFVNIIPLQLLAYHVAVLKGCAVDLLDIQNPVGLERKDH